MDQDEFEEQQENLDRVASRIGGAIIQFLRDCLHSEDQTFHADELHVAVLRATGIQAPASADRILRDLRQKKVVDYVVLNRRQSLYQILWVAGEPEEPEVALSTEDGNDF